MSIPTSTSDLEQRIDALLQKLTVREKVSLLSGKDPWQTVPIERLGIPSLVMTDGPHGVRAADDGTGRPTGPTTAFPTGISFAATWNPDLVERVGAALGEETVAMGCDILLGPCINMVRTPLGGRNFETYAEDPYLAGRIGVAWVRGLQSRGAGASVKHYAANNHEIERFRNNIVVDERTLHEIYLPAFETIVKEAQPWTVMCVYNRLNGAYGSQNHHLLTGILKEEWGFDGLVVSDWGANHTTVESVVGGLDLEMPGPARYFGNLLVDAVRIWQIDEALVDAAARRILRIVLRSGKMDGGAGRPAGAVNTPEHQAVARQVAEEAITLLKNDGALLPLGAGPIRSIAVIGPNAATAILGGGGSAFVEPPYRVSPLAGIQARAGERVQIAYEPGCDNAIEPPILPAEWLADGGFHAEYFSGSRLDGPAQLVRTDRQLDFWWWGTGPAEGVSGKEFAVRWTGKLHVPASEFYTLKVGATGECRVYLDGELQIETHGTAGEEFPRSLAMGAVRKQLEAGRAYDLRIEYRKPVGQEIGVMSARMMASPDPAADPRLSRAVELARRCDVAVVFVGMPEKYETEGDDRPDLELPGRQNELVAAVVAANPRTVVVLNVGAPVTLPWLDRVPAVLQMYYPGMEGGHAIARVLFGDVNPSGKLTVTYPRRLQDSPAYNNMTYPGAREVRYGEGIFIGYRHFDRAGVEPLFPFGHGLSYTTFEYGALQMPAVCKAGEPVEVVVTIKNTGAVAGQEVVQLYVRDVASSLPRPPKELKGFHKVTLAPNESRTVTFTLDARAFSFYDAHAARWVAEPGEFEIQIGSSSRDIRTKGAVTLQ